MRTHLAAFLGKRKKQSSGFFCLLLWQLGAEHQQVPFLLFFVVALSVEAIFLRKYFDNYFITRIVLKNITFSFYIAFNSNSLHK